MRNRYLVIAIPFVAVVLYMVTMQAKARPRMAAASADTETIYALPDGRRFTSHGRYFRSQSGQVREERGGAAIITDLRNHTVTLLSDETKEAHVFKVPPSGRQHQKPEPASNAPVERGTHEGHAVSKVRLDAGSGKHHELWTATDTGLLVYSRMESPEGVSTHKMLRNVNVGEPDPSLFAVPADYKRFVHDGLPPSQPASVPFVTRVPKPGQGR